MRLSKSLCAVVGDVLATTGSHPTLDALFQSAGAPGEPPNLAHHSKWKEWLFRAGQDPGVDSLEVLGAVLEEFMDRSPKHGTPEVDIWKEQREQIETALEDNGLRYYRFGRVLPQGNLPDQTSIPAFKQGPASPAKPNKVEELLEIVIRGL